MNITNLNFSDEEFKELVNSYLKILILSISIDNKIDKKEIKILFSLLTKVDIEDDNSNLSKLNYFRKFNNLNSKVLAIEDSYFDYVRVLDLENIIFYEWEKSLHLILSNLSKTNNLSFDEKMLKLEKYLTSIKKIIENHRVKLGDDYVTIFYYGIFFYVELIAQQDWKIFGNKIVKEEKIYIKKIKEELKITDMIKESSIEKLRVPILDI